MQNIIESTQGLNWYFLCYDYGYAQYINIISNILYEIEQLKYDLKENATGALNRKKK